MIAPFLLAVITATVPPKLDGITVGQNVATVIKAREIPIDRDNPTINNTNAGHVWTWTQKDGTLEHLTTDDDGVVQMIDILASPANQQWITVPVADSLQFNESGHINALWYGAEPDLFTDERLPGSRRAATVVGYAIEPDYGVLFAFDASQGDGGMIEVLTGKRAALFQTGLIPERSGNRAMLTPQLQPPSTRDAYKPPRLVQWPGCSGFIRGRVVFVRLAVGSDGLPTNATVFAGSGPTSVENAALYCPMQSKFEPARLNGKPVPSVVFQRRII